MNTWKKNLEETKQHYIDWWNRKGIVLNMWEHFQEGVQPHADVPAPPPPIDLNQKWFDPEWRAQYLDWYVAHSSLKADILPVANTQLGPGSLAAILGGVLEGGDDTIWIHPSPAITDDIRFDTHHPNWLLHKELLRACKQKAQGHYYVGMPDLMEGLDVLAALRGTDKVLLDTVMRPELLESQLQAINDIYFKVFDELYDIIREGDEMAFCYFSSWAPGKMSKLQSDISTMLSPDDFRRFVQPYIRQQCQRIDYTLYHLDGVGAMHHLPALLEIEELDAIQWTPGVGQPQGGSPKWYSLYRQILDGGKSLMACWVTIDELRPLLDHIGGEGVHIEMDFHNEREVEQALRIVEEYQTSDQKDEKKLNDTVQVKKSSKPSLAKVAEKRILILDGGMGTMIQRHGLEEEDFRGEQFAQHPVTLKGCNDLLSLTRPDVIGGIHQKYLEAGADLIETNTFNAQRISLADFGMESEVRRINLAACRIARDMADRYSTNEKPRYVLGSVGPTSKICSMATGGSPALNTQILREAYAEQMEALLEGGVDAILIETIFDTLNSRIAMDAATEAMKKADRKVPIMLSFSVSTPDGHNMLGQSVLEFLSSVPIDQVLSIGINCLADVKAFTPLVKELGERFPKLISFYPNAGMPDDDGHYSITPEEMQGLVWPLVEGHHLNIFGGCCGTTDVIISAFERLTHPLPGIFVSPHRPKTGNEVNHYRRIGIPGHLSSSPTPSSPSTPRHRLYHAILEGVEAVASSAAQEAIAEGNKAEELVNDEMIRAMSDLGKQFEEGKVFVPQLLMAGRAMKEALKVVRPVMASATLTTQGKVLIGTVKGDLHDIGKNLVASMLEGCGFEVVNIGIDVSAGEFVEAVRTHHPQILCLSALLTTTMGYMRDVIGALEEAGLRDQVKIIVGGAPVSQKFADEIGADGYGSNANTAVEVARRLLGR